MIKTLGLPRGFDPTTPYKEWGVVETKQTATRMSHWTKQGNDKPLHVERTFAQSPADLTSDGCYKSPPPASVGNSLTNMICRSRQSCAYTHTL